MAEYFAPVTVVTFITREKKGTASSVIKHIHNRRGT